MPLYASDSLTNAIQIAGCCFRRHSTSNYLEPRTLIEVSLLGQSLPCWPDDPAHGHEGSEVSLGFNPGM